MSNPSEADRKKAAEIVGGRGALRLSAGGVDILIQTIALALSAARAEQDVEQALAELREMFPNRCINLSIYRGVLALRPGSKFPFT